ASTDAAGTLETPIQFAAGQAPYVRTFGGGDNRWGDFSSITPDPSTSSGFFLFNEYAMTQGTPILNENGRWATRVADVTVTGGTASPLVASATNSSSPADQSITQLVHSMAAFGGAGGPSGVTPHFGDGSGLADLFAASGRHLT